MHAFRADGIAAMAQAGAAPRWWKCDTHGPATAGAWGCPECVREMRGEIERLHAMLLGSVAAERERCAKLCEDISDEYQRREGTKYPELRSDAQTGASDCAAAIRRA